MTTAPPSRRSSRLPRIAADVLVAGSVWSVVSIALPHRSWLRLVDEVFGVLGVPVAPNLFIAATLFLLAESVRRRLRLAWWIVVLAQAISLLLYIASLALLTASAGAAVDDHSFWSHLPVAVAMADTAVGALASLALVAIFVRRRGEFHAHGRPGAFWRALGALVSGIAAVLVVVYALTYPFHGNLHGAGERLWWSLRHTLGFSLPVGLEPTTHRGPWWLGSLAGLAATLVLLYAMGIFLHSARRSELMTPVEELRLRALLDRYGDQDSLSYFATRRDKSVVFSRDGEAAITYRVMGPVCLAAGDPVGAVEAWPAAIEAWRAHAREHGWHLGVLSASEQGAEAYARAGLRARTLGDEAVVDLESFTLEGRAMRPVKRAVARVRAAGCTVTLERHGDLDEDALVELERLADQWRGDEPDRGFSMALNRVGDPCDDRCVLAMVRDADGHPVALQSYVPWGTRGLSLDLMRRSPGAPNGVNEAIVAAVAEAAGDLGVRRLSLNFAMFRTVFSDADKVGAGVGLRLADRVLTVASRFWQLESLYESNAKYQPRWEPRFVCFEQVSVLPQIGLAAGVAEGFLPGRHLGDTYSGRTLVAVESDPGAPRPLWELTREQDRELLTPVRPQRRIGEQQRMRLRRLDVLREAGMEAYPVGVPRTSTLEAVRGAVDDPAAAQQVVSVTGRVRALRRLGGVTFALLEERGERLQAVLERDRLPGDLWRLWRRGVDVGDHVSVTGVPGRSRTGEPSILVSSWQMAAKCLRPVPDARTGFSNPEARVRQRYLDLIVNPDSRAMMYARTRAVAAVRRAFTERGFVEVETPMLQAIHGGASARPFRTHINAYNADLYLRIAPELYLKELAVGGMDRIFELNRNFRNEGADATHNPEFTSVEAYAAYGDYTTMRVLTRELVLEVATAVHGEPVAVRPGPDGRPERVRLDVEWPVVTVHEAISRATGRTITSATTRDELKQVAGEQGIHVGSHMTVGDIVSELYDELVEKRTTFPTFYTDFPLETSPLTRTHRSDPTLSERWDLVAWGAEMGTAYSELVDPVDQRERLTEQSYRAAAGDPEAMEIDEGFLTALEYAMPPTGGLGIGVDRLVMMLTGSNIRATLAFPFTRPTEQV